MVGGGPVVEVDGGVGGGAGEEEEGWGAEVGRGEEEGVEEWGGAGAEAAAEEGVGVEEAFGEEGGGGELVAELVGVEEDEDLGGGGDRGGWEVGAEADGFRSLAAGGANLSLLLLLVFVLRIFVAAVEAAAAVHFHFHFREWKQKKKKQQQQQQQTMHAPGAQTPISDSDVIPSISSRSTTSSALDATSFTYTPFYCEENVYLLCKKLCEIGVADPDGIDLFVVFISNEDKQATLWHQKASQRIDGLTVWDYHVICIQRKVEGNLLRVWDLDSSLPFPSPLNQYVAQAIRPSFSLNSNFVRLFRVVHVPIFLHYFASDRRHMKNPDGNWIAQPPPYEPIVAEDGTVNNLSDYIGMKVADVRTNVGDLIEGLFSEKLGVVVSETQLENLFSCIP
ncbi:protein N-terminal glutamine amidohydrolase [Cinnamomum micranthum f. kanehirae]|uniref:Protein N-terminal glutamine amidohydrolase n=1 Tax=Cinnamomum micranthum f. kanehirae TaxID=337451 RepID=A0A3S3NF10_9MAGN|nr:protein N-terminal glutamine amidohydrolase [Cinnamomum micranthum f. kanehirae]